MYFLVKDGKVSKKQELSFDDLKQLKASEMTGIDYVNNMAFDATTGSWESLRLNIAKPTKPADIVRIDRFAVNRLRQIATKNYMDGKYGDTDAKALQILLYIEALHSFLLEKGVDPKFKVEFK